MENTDKLKEKLLTMAKVFHKFCQDNNIRYYMIGGTLLGAIRHKGFIPWDDDIDFGVPRKDYDKLISLRSKLPDGYSFNVHTDGKHFKYGFCKMYDENTTYIESAVDSKYIGGVYIDIFPLDNIGDDLNKAITLARKIRVKKKFIETIYKKGNRSTFLKSLLARTVQLLPENPKWFEKPYNVIKKFKGKPSKYVINVYGVYGGKEVTDKSVLGNPVLYDFEDTKLYGVENYDAYLKNIYGDYMTPPPENKRGGHSICYFNSEKPYKEYIQDMAEKAKNN